MSDSASTLTILPSSEAVLPRECSFSESDWRALAPYWYPVAFSREVGTEPHAVRLLDERVVLYRLSDGKVFAARDICLHRGVPLSMGHVEGDEIVCKYHGLRYDRSGQCVCIPAHPKGAISPRLHLTMYEAREAYGLIWVRLVDDGGPETFPEFPEWDDPDFIQVLPDSISLNASAGRQVEGFLDVAHFAFVHLKSFGEPDNATVPDYPVEKTPNGFVADYVSTVSNYGHGFKHLNPPGFLWRRRFQVWFPFTAKLTIFFPNEGRLNILNTASPISARKTRMFAPLCRNFDRDAPLEATLDFNAMIFAEDKEVVENQFPEELPIDLHAEAHFPADRSSITYRKGLAARGLGRTYTA
jgi:vanillate O-demethylase monooxygenase subunit